MSEAAVPASEASGKRSWGRCCLWSLGTLGVVAGLTMLALWFGWTRLAGPWLRQQQSELSGAHPLVGAVLDYAVSGKVGIVPVRKPVLSRVEGGSREPSAFPKEIYIPEGAERSAFRTSREQALAVLTYRSRDAESLTRACRLAMQKEGWKAQEGASTGSGLRFFQSGRVADYLVTTGNDGFTRLWVHCFRQQSRNKKRGTRN